MYLIDDFVTTSPGEPFRLFPFGTVTKNGRSHTITPSSAKTFKLPHFKPPIKLGSHGEATPAGGHIVGLEVRDDGLYAVPEWNENGTSAVTQGNYRYHSPEVIWEGGGLEDSATGNIIEGPLVVGLALLHMPALGEHAAMYSVNQTPINGGKEIMTEMVQVPVSFFDKLTSLFNRQESEPEPTPQPKPDEFAAQVEAMEAKHKAELEAYAAKVEAMETEKAQRERIAHFSTALQETKLAGNNAIVELLAGLKDEQAALILQEFNALSAQIDSGLETPIGDNPNHGASAEAKQAAEIKAYQEKHGVPYHVAIKKLASAKPELFAEVENV